MRKHKKDDSWFNRYMKMWERTKIKKIYKKRSAIERYFSRKKHVFHLGEERTRGLKNFEANAYFVSIMEILEYAARPETWVLIFTKLDNMPFKPCIYHNNEFCARYFLNRNIRNAPTPIKML